MVQTENNYDLIVAGGGLAGVAAAIAAAREGAQVLLLERYGFLGGMATAGLVNPLMAYCTYTGPYQYDWSNKTNEGIFREMLENLKNLDGLGADHVTFNEELLKLVLNRLTEKYKIKVLLHTFVSDVVREGALIKAVKTVSKSGTRKYTARYFVDASGDADLAALSGCEFKIGREEDGLCQPMTLCFRLANVDMSKFKWENRNEIFSAVYKEFKARGLLKNPREDVLTFSHCVHNVVHFNSTRITHKSAVNAEELTEAEIEAREQVYELYKFMKENISGFENCQLLMTAPQIGIRESRRIVGEYVIAAEDMLGARKFEDSVARGTYPVDIHNPSGSGTTIHHIPYGDYYTIPYRALLPKGVDNLIIAGRPISSTHEAHSAFRVMPICMCMGEGAGTACAIAMKNGAALRDISVRELHALMDKNKALY